TILLVGALSPSPSISGIKLVISNTHILPLLSNVIAIGELISGSDATSITSNPSSTTMVRSALSGLSGGAYCTKLSIKALSRGVDCELLCTSVLHELKQNKHAKKVANARYFFIF